MLVRTVKSRPEAKRIIPGMLNSEVVAFPGTWQRAGRPEGGLQRDSAEERSLRSTSRAWVRAGPRGGRHSRALRGPGSWTHMAGRPWYLAVPLLVWPKVSSMTSRQRMREQGVVGSRRVPGLECGVPKRGGDCNRVPRTPRDRSCPSVE